MRPYELKTAIAKLQTVLDNAEQINLAFFATKLAKTAEQYPEDLTIGQINQVINKINNSSNQLFISRAEVKDLYRRLYSRNTKFAELFNEELGETIKLPSPTLYQREIDKPELDLYEGSDQVLLAGLKNSMGEAKHAIPSSLVQAAEKLVELECSFPKMVPEVKTVGGNEACVICSASYPTSKGKATLFVPVEVIQKKATLPTIFVGKTGTKDLTRQNIEQYLEDFFVVKGSHGNTETKAPNQELQVEIPKDAELESFAWKFDSSAGLAAFQFGPKAEAARQWISKKLYALGKNAHQVSVLNSDDRGITFGVKCDQLSFKVPVKVDDNKFYEPTIFLCNGGIEAFDVVGLKRLEKKAAIDSQLMAKISSLSELKPSELVNLVEEAVSEENYVKAEDALNVLANSGDDKAYKVAFEIYNNGLTGIKKEVSAHQCNRIVKNSTSTQPLCGHLNVPLNKTYVDKQGQCRLQYAQATDQSYEGTSFLHSKIFV